jgi:hypothetical protein
MLSDHIYLPTSRVPAGLREEESKISFDSWIRSAKNMPCLFRVQKKFLGLNISQFQGKGMEKPQRAVFEKRKKS